MGRMAVKPTKNCRQSRGAPCRKSGLPESDYRFDRLAEDEYEDCFRYEIQRTMAPIRRRILQKELANIPTDVAMPPEPDEAEVSLAARRFDLEEQLDFLNAYRRPWLELRDKDKAQFKGTRKPAVDRLCEPVQTFDRLDLVGRVFLRLAEKGEVEKVTLVIDWTRPDTELADSFTRLLSWMRRHRGKDKLLPQRRGRKSKTIEERLFGLAVWRCRQHDMTYDRIWDFLVDVRKKMGIGHRNKGTLSRFSKMIEQIIG